MKIPLQPRTRREWHFWHSGVAYGLWQGWRLRDAWTKLRLAREQGQLPRVDRVMLHFEAALHELRCDECRVTWRSWLQRLVGDPRGMTP